MKRLLTGIALAVVACASDQQPPTDRTVAAAYFSAPVEIDGRLDPHLSHLAAAEFPHIFTFDNPEVDAAAITYRVGYSDTHLYVFIQTDAETVTEHRRGWLWGDGFKLIVTQPEDEERTPHFYEIGYSPNTLDGYEAFNQILVAYNHQPTWRQLSDSSRSAAAPNADGTGFEAMIAWDDIAPYNPFTSDRLGINLYFAKAYYTEAEGQFPNGHALTPDEGIWDESLTDRSYVPLSFETPELSTSTALAIRPSRGRMLEGETMGARFVAHVSDAFNADILIEEEAGTVVARSQVSFDPVAGLYDQQLELPVSALPSGQYTVRAQLEGTEASAPFTIFPNVDFEAVARTLAANVQGVEPGVAHTISFKLEQYRDSLNTRPAYETAAQSLEDWTEINTLLTAFEAGENPFEGKVDAYRRAFLSEQDGTYQPYSINLPDDYDPDQSYPLLVFLHGSAQTDEGLLNTSRSNGRFIEIAPFGRDMYEAYTARASQRDIVEAIEDAQRYFNVDGERIVIAGFSMGGYGALRTYHENPDLYAGVAVLAGHPNLANEWLGFGHPNFLEDRHSETFADVPVFVYHGEADEALDPNQIRAFAASVEAAGGDVTTAFVPGRGHRYPDEASQALYTAWLDQFSNFESD